MFNLIKIIIHEVYITITNMSLFLGVYTKTGTACVYVEKGWGVTWICVGGGGNGVHR